MTVPSPTDDATVTAPPPGHRSPPTWREIHPGDDPGAETLQFDHWRASPPAVKMRELAALNDMARRLALVGLRQRHPSAGPEELHRLLADLLLGADLAMAVYGPHFRASAGP